MADKIGVIQRQVLSFDGDELRKIVDALFYVGEDDLAEEIIDLSPEYDWDEARCDCEDYGRCFREKVDEALNSPEKNRPHDEVMGEFRARLSEGK